MLKLILSLVLLLVSLSPAFAENLVALKASYIYHFTKFIQWEDNHSDSYIKLCVYNTNEEMDKQLASLHGKTFKNKAFLIKKLDRADSTSECHLLYVQGKAISLALDWLEDQQRYLIIADQHNQSADIHFIINNGKLRFSIDRSKIKHKALKVSSRLLRLSS